MRIDNSDVSDIPIGNVDIVLSPISVIIDSCPIRTDYISQIFQILLGLEKIDLV